MGETGTPHIQGFVTFKKKVRPLNIININRIHWEKAHGNDASQNYCGKDGKVFLSKGIPKPLVQVTYDMLRENQKEIVDLFKEDEDPLHGRKIYWFWEKKGNWGKSFTCLYLIDQCDAMVVQGKGNDILYGVKAYFDIHGCIPRIIIFDIPRCNENFVSHSAIEQLKNGFMFSGKYEGGMVRFNKPHVLCFSNEKPDMLKLSKDRWIIKKLN